MSEASTNEQTHLPATSKQLAFAHKLAQRNNSVLDWDTQQDRWHLSRWIGEQIEVTKARPNRPSSKQVAFAERIARVKRLIVPNECFQSAELMSRWITANK